MPTTILNLPERCLRRVFAFLPLRDLLRLDQCYLGWISAQRAVCLTRTTLTISVREDPEVLGWYQWEKYQYLWTIDDAIPRSAGLGPTFLNDDKSGLSDCHFGLPLQANFDTLQLDWLYGKFSDFLVSMLPNVSHLNIHALQRCYRYIGERSNMNRLVLMESIFKLVNKWAKQLVRLNLNLHPYYKDDQSDQWRSDWCLMVQTLNRMPALRQLSLSFDKIFFESAPNVVEEDEEKLAELRLELTFLSKLTHLYLNVDKGGSEEMKKNRAWNVIHDYFTDSQLFRYCTDESLQTLILSDMGYRMEDLHRPVFQRFAKQIKLLPEVNFIPHFEYDSAYAQLHKERLASFVNLRSVTLHIDYDEATKLAKIISPYLTPLKQLIRLYLDLSSSETVELNEIVDAKEVFPNLRMLHLHTYIYLENPSDWEGRISEFPDWSELFPSLQIVTMDNNNLESYWDHDKELPVSLKPSPGEEYCACERWALQMFGHCPELSALYTTHDQDCHRLDDDDSD